MLLPKIFLTGATGYIGGDFLHAAVAAHPDWQFACLVRDTAKADSLARKYPLVRIVRGDLGSEELLEEEAANANIIYHFANSDHTGSARAIARGVARNQNSIVHWIHTSGAGILTFKNFALNTFGFRLADERTYDDWDGISELMSLPDKALHRHVDKIVLAASKDDADRIKTAIVAPPAIYGAGRGTGNTRSVQVYVAANLALKHGTAMQIGDGSDTWHGVHINDLSDLYLRLGESTISQTSTATWNDAGYYLAENGAFKWGDIMQLIADTGHEQGFLASTEVRSLSFKEAQALHSLFPFLCGTTSRGVSKRAQNLLGWKPESDTLQQEIPRVVRNEASELGLLKPKV